MSKSVLAVIFGSVADTILLVSVEGHLETPEGNGSFITADSYVLTCVGDKVN